MAVPVFTPSVEPDFNSSEDVAFKILENQFGDGYAQRSADGLNNTRRSWSVSWTNVTDAEMSEIYDFLIARGGWESFLWTAPKATGQLRWTCRSLKRQPTTSGYWKISASFRQEFDL
jgi:phage-related protein